MTLFTLSLAAQARELPPIDQQRPADLHVATFALG